MRALVIALALSWISATLFAFPAPISAGSVSAYEDVDAGSLWLADAADPASESDSDSDDDDSSEPSDQDAIVHAGLAPLPPSVASRFGEQQPPTSHSSVRRAPEPPPPRV